MSNAGLVPVEVADRWLTHLNWEFPSVVLKSTNTPARIEVPLHGGR
jgi:hypothetical protein